MHRFAGLFRACFVVIGLRQPFEPRTMANRAVSLWPANSRSWWPNVRVCFGVIRWAVVSPELGGYSELSPREPELIVPAGGKFAQLLHSDPARKPTFDCGPDEGGG